MILHNQLKAILAAKVIEVERLYQNDANSKLQVLLAGEKITLHHHPKSLHHALRNGGDKLSVIAEVKRSSPSKGMLSDIKDPLALVDQYVLGGANAISVLTDREFFGGSLNDLKLIAQHLQREEQPILRKDFIIDAIQIAEAVIAGADAVLLIARILEPEKLRQLLEQTRKMQIEALVEVHDKHDLQLAVNCGAEIIGINNRDLTTFSVNVNHALNLHKYIPQHVVTVAESGIHNAMIAQKYAAAGFDAVLIGEALVRNERPQKFLQSLKLASTV